MSFCHRQTRETTQYREHRVSTDYCILRCARLEQIEAVATNPIHMKVRMSCNAQCSTGALCLCMTYVLWSFASRTRVSCHSMTAKVSLAVSAVFFPPIAT